jgi:hypothetical protein
MRPLIGRQPSQDAAEPQCLLAQLRPHPVIPGGGGVTLVEGEIDDLEHGGEALDELGSARHFEANALLAQRAFGPHDTLRHRGLRHQKGARDFLGREPADQPQRQRGAGLRGQHRVAGGEDEPQQIIADVIVEGGIEVGLGCLARGLQLPAQLVVLALDQLAATQAIDGAMLGRRHQPGARLVRNPRLRPLLKRGDERVLRQLLGKAHIAHHTGKAGDELGLLDTEDRVDG